MNMGLFGGLFKPNISEHQRKGNIAARAYCPRAPRQCDDERRLDTIEYAAFKDKIEIVKLLRQMART